MAEPPVARLVHYTGQVQGVGFRAQACDIARRFAVAGWVRNLPDGQVALWAEGAEPEVEAFLLAVRDHWGDAVQREDVEPRPATGGLRGFVVSR